jgi:hypothetical protein
MDVAANEHVYVDGAFVAQEGQPTGQGDNWSTFDVVGVNDDGNYIFTGDTNGATTTDEFLAYNGQILVREGDTLDGVLIPSGATFRAASINNGNEVAHLWGITSAEHLFVGTAPDLAFSLRALSLGDSLDVDGDGGGDYVVADFNAATVVGPGLDLADDGFVYVDLDVEPLGQEAVQAIVRLGSPISGMAETNPARGVPFRLLPGRPNPFAETMGIEFVLARPTAGTLAIYDAAGRRVRDLWQGRGREGVNRVIWDGRDGRGVTLPAGIYFLRLAMGSEEQKQKAIRIE